MTRVEARRRRRRRRNLCRAAAWAVVFIAELLAAAIQAAVVAAVLIPIANAWRGYSAFGGEWVLVGALFCGAYCIIHKRVCDKIFEEGKHG